MIQLSSGQKAYLKSVWSRDTGFYKFLHMFFYRKLMRWTWKSSKLIWIGMTQKRNRTLFHSHHVGSSGARCPAEGVDTPPANACMSHVLKKTHIAKPRHVLTRSKASLRASVPHLLSWWPCPRPLHLHWRWNWVLRSPCPRSSGPGRRNTDYGVFGK